MPDFGLPDKTAAIIRQIFADFPAVEKAVLYGSRAKGNYRHGSDIDLTLFGDLLDFDALLKIGSRLDESPIPYQVDLSLWKQLDHAGLREHIERVGVVFYERDGDAVISAICATIHRNHNPLLNRRSYLIKFPFHIERVRVGS